MALLLDEVRLSRDALRYGFAVGKVRVLERRRLDLAAFERLIDARTFVEQKRLLSDTPYGRFLETAQTAEDVEHGLAEALDYFYGFLGEAELPEPVARFFRIRYDFANLKAAVKARLLGAQVEELLVGHGSVPAEEFLGDLTKLPEPFATVASQLPNREASGLGDERASVAVDTVVDKAMFAELLSTAQASKSAYLVELARLAVDLANAKTLLRALRAGVSTDVLADQLIDGGAVAPAEFMRLAEMDSEHVPAAMGRIPALKGLDVDLVNDPATLDIALDTVTAAALRRGRMGQIGAEPVISYVLAREGEVASLRVVLLGRLAGLDNETLRRHLRSQV